MAKFDIKRLVSKGLQTDNGYENIPNGTYGYAENFRDSTLNSQSLERIKGTQVKLTLPVVTQQTKKIRITPLSVGRTNLTFYLGSFVTTLAYTITESQADASSPVIFNWDNGLSLVPDVINNSFVTSYNSSTQSSTISQAADSDLELYVVESGSTTGSPLFSITVIQEHLSDDVPGETGQLVPIGSYEIKNRLYIFSAISDNGIGGYGEIGYYDVITDSYTKIVGSKALRFTTRHQMDVVGEQREGSDNIYFTDNFNPVRSIVTNDPFYQSINYDALFSHILLNQQNSTSTFWNSNTGNGVAARFSSFDSTSGSLKTGTYRYAFRFKDSGYSPGEWSNISGPFEVKVNENTTQLGYVLPDRGWHVKGDHTSEYGNHAINLEMVGINTEKYQFFDVLIVYYEGSNTGNFTSGYIHENIPIFQSSAVYTHNDETNFQALTVAEVLSYLEDTTPCIDKAKSIRILNNRLLLGNVTKANYNNLFSQWAKSIDIVDELHTVDGLDISIKKNKPSDSHLHSNVAEYYDPINRAQKVGYMPHEEYRFGIQLKLKNGSWTDTFFIKDHRFDQGADTGPTSSSKPISFAWSDTSSKITYSAAAVTAGADFLKEGFVKGMYIAIQDEYEGQTIAQSKAYLEGSADFPTPTQCYGAGSLGSWYVNGNLIDFRRRMWYGNNGGGDYLKHPYFKILKVEADCITLDPSVGGVGLRHYCGESGDGVYSTNDKRRRVSSIYPPSFNKRWQHTEYNSNHPFFREEKTYTLNPRFIIDIEIVKPYISGYRIVRAPVIKEVLATGLAVVSENGKDCDAGLGLENKGRDSYFYPTFGSNTTAQRMFLGDYASSTGSTSPALDTYISPMFNNRTTNGNRSTPQHIPGDGKMNDFVSQRSSNVSNDNPSNTYDGAQDITYPKKDNINRPHPCVLDYSDMVSANASGSDHDFSLSGTSDYKPHYYSGRKMIYFHSPDFDISTTEDVPGFENEWKSYNSSDQFINLGRVYYGTNAEGPSNGDVDGKTGLGVSLGTAAGDGYSHISSTQAGKRKVFSVNTGWPYVQMNPPGTLGNEAVEEDSLHPQNYTGVPVNIPNADTISELEDVAIKPNDVHVLFCNRVPYIPLYGQGSDVGYETKKFMAQPGLSHNTFKHWTYYNIHDAKHTGANISNGNPARADGVNMYNPTIDVSTKVYSSISYGSGSVKGIDNSFPDNYDRRVRLDGTNSMYDLKRAIDAHDSAFIDGVGTNGTKSNLVCRAPKCMVISLTNKYGSPTTDEWGQTDDFSSGTGRNSTNKSIDPGTIGLTDGGGRNKNTATAGLDRQYHSVGNVYERNVYHNWAQFADRGENYSGDTSGITANGDYGAYGWNRMHDDTGMYMGMYFRQKSNYVNGEWSEEQSKYGSLGNTKYIQVGHCKEIYSTSANIQTDVIYGGDSMCQRSYRMINFSNAPGAHLAKHPYSNTEDANFTNNSSDYVVGPNQSTQSYDASGNLQGGSSDVGGCFDIWSNIMVAMYSINRINVQTRTVIDDTQWQNFAQPRAVFPFGAQLSSMLFLKNTPQLKKYVTLGGVQPSETTANVTSTLSTPRYQRNNAQLIWGHGGHESSNTDLSALTGSDKLEIHNSYIVAEGDVGVSYGYNPISQVAQDLSTRIYYSDERKVHDVVDYYKAFNKVNYTDLGVHLGAINHLEVVNGELYAFQDDAFSKLFMKERTLLQGNESGSSIILGAQDVFSNKERVLTGYGTTEKFSVLKGVTKEGSEVLLWVNAIHGKILRFDAKSGVNSISDLFGISETTKILCEGMSNYILSNPTGVGGIHGVWDNENSEFVITWNYSFIPGEVNPEIIEYTTNTDYTDTFFGQTEEEPIDGDTDDPIGEDGIDLEGDDVTDAGDDTEDAGDVVDETTPSEEEEEGSDDNPIDDGGGIVDDENTEELSDDENGDVDETNPDTDSEDLDNNGIDDDDSTVDELIDDTTTGGASDDDIQPPIPPNPLEPLGPSDPTITGPIGTHHGSTALFVNDQIIKEDVVDVIINIASGHDFIPFIQNDNKKDVLGGGLTDGGSTTVRRAILTVQQLLFGKNGSMVGDQISIKQFIDIVLRYIANPDKSAVGQSAGSKDPIINSGKDHKTDKTIQATSDKLFLDNYTSNTTRTNLRSSVPTSNLVTSRNSFINKDAILLPRKRGGILFNFDFRENRNIINTSHKKASTNDEVEYVLGNDMGRKLSEPIHKNSRFNQGTRGWDFKYVGTTKHFVDSDNVLHLSAISGSDYLSIFPKVGQTAQGSIVFSSIPNAGATFKIIDTKGVTKTYKAVNQTAAGVISEKINGAQDLTDNTILFERGEDETGATAQKTAAVNCLMKAIKSGNGHRGSIKVSSSVAGTMELVQLIRGLDGNTNITATGTHNSTVTNFADGLGDFKGTMPGFVTHSKNKVLNKSIKPYKLGQIVQIVVEYTIDTSTYNNGVVRINQSSSNANTADSNGIVINSTNGDNRHVLYLKLASATPIVTLAINNCEIELRQFQVKVVNGDHLVLSGQTNRPIFKGIDATHTRQRTTAVTAVSTGTPSYLKTNTWPVNKRNNFATSHTIALVVSSNGNTGNSNIFEFKDGARTYFALRTNSASANAQYYASTTEGSGSGPIPKTRTEGYFENINPNYDTGPTNIIIAEYSGTTYSVYGNGFTGSDKVQLTGVNLSSLSSNVEFTFGRQNGFSVKDCIVFDNALGDAERKKLFKYLSWKHSGAMSAGQSINAVVSADAYIIPTSFRNAIYKNNAIGDTRGPISGTDYTLYAEQFLDNTATLSNETTTENFYVAKAKIKALGFTGGVDGSANGPDAWTVKIIPSGGSATVIDEPSTINWKNLTANGGEYELETRFTATKGTGVTLGIYVVRTTATNTSSFVYEVSNLSLKKGFKYEIPQTKNGKTVLAKVNTPTEVKVFQRNSSSLTGYANDFKDAAKLTNPLVATGSWTEISQDLVSSGNLEIVRQNVDQINGQEDMLSVGQYFTKASLSWSEHRKKFTSFYSFVPELYLPFKDSYFSHSQLYDTAQGGVTHIHSHDAPTYGNFYGALRKSVIFIPVNEISENQKTMYTTILDGSVNDVASVTGKFSAVNTTGSNYVLIDSSVSGTTDKKDDYYTITPQDRIHGKAFVVKIESSSANTAYLKINGIIARVRSEAPTRNLLSKQNPLKGLTKKK